MNELQVIESVKFATKKKGKRKRKKKSGDESDDDSMSQLRAAKLYNVKLEKIVKELKEQVATLTRQMNEDKGKLEDVEEIFGTIGKQLTIVNDGDETNEELRVFDEVQNQILAMGGQEPIMTGKMIAREMPGQLGQVNADAGAKPDIRTAMNNGGQKDLAMGGQEPMVTEQMDMSEMPGQLGQVNTNTGAKPKIRTAINGGVQKDLVNGGKNADFSEVESGRRNNSAAEDQTKGKGKTSPPIIKMYNVNVKELTIKLRGVLGHGLFSFNVVNRNMVNLKLGSVADHQKVRLLLEGERVSFFTYTPRDMKPYTMIIKGLSDTYEVEDLRTFIVDSKFDVDIRKIVKLRNDRWLIQVTNDSDVKSFRQLQYLINSKVKIQKYKQEGLIQCRNCQRFGHISTNCQMPYRCVKCGQSHGPGNCLIPGRESNTEETISPDPVTGQMVKKIGVPVRCINCGNEGHVASSRICPKRMEIEGRMNERKLVRRREPTPIVNGARITDGRSYASATRSTQSGTRVPNTANSNTADQVENAFRLFDSECKDRLGKDFMTCFKKIGEYADKYRSITDEGKRTQALFGLLLSIRLYD